MRNNKRPMSNHSGHGGGQRKFNRPQGGGYGNQQNRPRKNYGALREKYLNQARDALSAGDRVLAENYFQHADHYYRMMMEENERRAQYQQQNQQNNPQQPDSAPAQAEPAYDTASDVMDELPAAGSLPSFLTQPIPVAAKSPQEQPAMAADWEE